MGFFFVGMILFHGGFCFVGMPIPNNYGLLTYTGVGGLYLRLSSDFV